MAKKTVREDIAVIVFEYATTIRNGLKNLSKELSERADRLESADPVGNAIQIQGFREASQERMTAAHTFQDWIDCGRP